MPDAADTVADRRLQEFTAAFLHEIRARRGGIFLLGNWGKVKITILRTGKQSKGGHTIWVLRMAEEANRDADQNSDAEPDTEQAPEFTVAFLHEMKAKRGGSYLIGRLGLATVIIAKTSKKSKNGYSIWTLRLLEERDKEADEKTTAPAGAGPVVATAQTMEAPF